MEAEKGEEMAENSCNCENCSLKPVGPGKDAPDVVNVIVEMQKGGGQNKYEYAYAAKNNLDSTDHLF